MRVPWLLVLAGCGRVAFKPDADAAPDAPLGPWGPAREVSELASGVDDDPSLTGDQLEIFFNSRRAGTSDIWHATRATIDAPWSGIELVTELSSSAADNTPEVTADGLRMYLSSARAGSNNIYFAARPSRSAQWTVPVGVGELNTAASEVAAGMAPDELELFMSRSGGTNGTEVLRATRPDVGAPWSAPSVIAELSDPAFDSDSFTGDGLTLYWCSQRGTSSDIWSATRASRDQPFEMITRLDDINSSLEEDDPWISPDGHTMYFSRGSQFDVQMSIWMATR